MPTNQFGDEALDEPLARATQTKDEDDDDDRKVSRDDSSRFLFFFFL